MSSDPSKAAEVPGTSSSFRSIGPPKRFLVSSLHSSSSSRRLFLGSASVPTSRLVGLPSPPITTAQQSTSSSSTPVIPVKSSPPPLLVPPNLIRIPQIVLTPVDADHTCKTEEESSDLVVTEAAAAAKPVLALPPPPPLVRMPIFTRNDKRSAVATQERVRECKTSPDITAEMVREPPRKRTRLGDRDRTSESSTSTTVTTVSTPGTAPPTPRKIIQDIFGPDKSKKSKGKGRKRKKTGGTSKKKGRHVQKEVEAEVETAEQHDLEDEQVEEHKSEEEEEEEEPEKMVDEPEEDADAVQVTSEVADVRDSEAAKSELEEPMDVHSQEETVEDEGQSEGDTESVASSTRRVSRRKAKQVANEKLKRLSLHNEEEKDNEGDENESSASAKVESSTSKEESAAAGIRSRRSTTEGSSKSGSSTNQDDSESSVGGGGRAYVNRHLAVDRQRSNPTPLSLVSEDGDQDDVKGEGGDTASVGDFQEHRDSDVDSTYSWKPVRAAAAVALEQVTKKQGSVTGSTGDGEGKVSAAAERRARKIMRYKGRNRRTLMFKSSSSKKLIAARKNNRYSAQPTIVPKLLHDGTYLQPGDIVYVEQENEMPIFGQIRGILMDHFGDVSVGVRWLAAKCHLHELIDFSPMNYSIRYDMPERLMKLEYVNFVMHLNLDYFDGHPSYQKMEKFSIYTRLGKSINSYMNEMEREDGSTVDGGQTSSSQSGAEEKSKDNKKAGGVGEDSSDTSETDCSDVEEVDDDDQSNTMHMEGESLEVRESETNNDETNEDNEEINTDENEIISENQDLGCLEASPAEDPKETAETNPEEEHEYDEESTNMETGEDVENQDS